MMVLRLGVNLPACLWLVALQGGLGPSQPALPTAFLDFFFVERAFLAFSTTA